MKRFNDGSLHKMMYEDSVPVIVLAGSIT